MTRPKNGRPYKLRLHTADVRDAWIRLGDEPAEVWVAEGATRVLVMDKRSRSYACALAGLFNRQITLIDFAEAIEAAADELLESLGLPSGCGPQAVRGVQGRAA
jgi:hypothetical protein